MFRAVRYVGAVDWLHAAAVPVERAGGLFVDAAIPGVDDGVGVEGPLMGREKSVILCTSSYIYLFRFCMLCSICN